MVEWLEKEGIMLEGCQWFENVSWGEIKRFRSIFLIIIFFDKIKFTRPHFYKVYGNMRKLF